MVVVLRRGPSAAVRGWLAGRLPGAGERRRQTDAYLEAWRIDNEAAMAAEGPLWVVLGDSSAQGIGTSRRERGYVGSVVAALRRARDPRWRVVNLSCSGARVGDVVAQQLPRVAALAPDLVSAAAGANDLLRTPTRRLAADLRALAAGLPEGALLANLPQGLAERRVAPINGLIGELVAEHGLVLVDLWRHTGPPWAGRFSADHFHPNDRGYETWTAAFLEALGLEPGGAT